VRDAIVLVTFPRTRPVSSGARFPEPATLLVTLGAWESIACLVRIRAFCGQLRSPPRFQGFAWNRWPGLCGPASAACRRIPAVGMWPGDFSERQLAQGSAAKLDSTHLTRIAAVLPVRASARPRGPVIDCSRASASWAGWRGKGTAGRSGTG
jgi:hypothetical protein